MKIVGKILVAMVAALIAVAFLSIVDDAYYGNRHIHRITIEPDCGYVVPAGYKIVYSEKERAYAVEWNKLWKDCYLVDCSYGITWTFISTEKPALFDNECQARAYIKSYMKQREPKINDFK